MVDAGFRALVPGRISDDARLLARASSDDRRRAGRSSGTAIGLLVDPQLVPDQDFSLPGGYVRPGETEAASAAARELGEEVGVSVAESALKYRYRGVYIYESCIDQVTIFEADASATRRASHRQSRSRSGPKFVSRDDALRMPLVPHLREYLSESLERSLIAVRGPGTQRLVPIIARAVDRAKETTADLPRTP